MPPFRFKQFTIHHDRCAHKVGTDGVLLGAWVEANDPKKILDVGTGSGVIALMMAQRFPEARTTAIELDTNSFEQACENIANSPFADRVEVIQGDFLKQDFPEKFDLIISNPPFFKGVYSSGNPRRDQARHESALPQKDFLKKAASLLSPEGNLALVLPREEGEQFLKEASRFTPPLHLHFHTKVYGSPATPDKRWLLFLGYEAKVPEENKFHLRDANGEFSEAYRTLARDFYFMF